MEMSQLIEVGTLVKFRIPFPSEDNVVAESPWRKVVGVKTFGRILVEVQNELICSDLHGYQFGDIVELEQVWLSPDSEAIWQAVG
jgi:hypothetical protein